MAINMTSNNRIKVFEKVNSPIRVIRQNKTILNILFFSVIRKNVRMDKAISHRIASVLGCVNRAENLTKFVVK